MVPELRVKAPPLRGRVGARPWTGGRPEATSLHNSCRPCGNSAQHLRSSVFFHANHGKWPSLESRCSYLAFFGKFFFLPLKSASFHTVSETIAARPNVILGALSGAARFRTIGSLLGG